MLTCHRWFGRTLNVAVVGRSQPIIRAGLFSNAIAFSDPAVELTFSRLYAGSMSDMAAKFRLSVPENQNIPAEQDVKAEFA
jgi:hypothetical protein